MTRTLTIALVLAGVTAAVVFLAWQFRQRTVEQPTAAAPSQRQDEALGELAAAARAAPGNARYAFVHAVALHSSGRAREAINELERGLAAAPADRDILEALAQFLAETGDERRAEAIRDRLQQPN